MSSASAAADAKRDLEWMRKGMQDTLSDLENACNVLPYGFKSLTNAQKRVCLEDIAETGRKVMKFRDVLRDKYLAVEPAGENACVEMYCNPIALLVCPSPEELKRALDAMERITIDVPVPTVVRTYEEEVYTFKDGPDTKFFAEFKTQDEAARILRMGTVMMVNERGYKLNIQFRPALPKEVRANWMTIQKRLDELRTVHANLKAIGATETNDPYPFKVEVWPTLVEDATPDLVERLENLRQKFDAGEAGSDLMLLQMKPVSMAELSAEVERLNSERIHLIITLRKFQAQKYEFDFELGF